MPAPGDQHKSIGPATANPYEEVRPQPTPYTAAEIATLQSRLDKQLGPEYISSRPGASGQKVHYVAGEKVINLANEVLGFNGWSSAIQNIQIDFVDENAQSGKISLGLSVIVRVTLRDGTYHEDIGYGNIENCKGKAAAFQKAKKEGTTDALKRALRTFGNVLGNCIYDKEFLGRVTRMKAGKGKWDEQELHRHPDFVSVKPDPAVVLPDTRGAEISGQETGASLEDEFDEDFGDAEFDDGEFGDPDQVALPEPANSKQKYPQNVPHQGMGPPGRSNATTPSRVPHVASVNGPLITGPQGGSMFQPNNTSAQETRGISTASHKTSKTINDLEQSSDDTYGSSPGVLPQQFAPHPGMPLHGEPQQATRPTGFYNARAADLLDAENKLKSEAVPIVPTFNPHAETPSIRKTTGIDHNRSGPLRRDTLAKDYGIVTPGKPVGGASGPAGKDFTDPRADSLRRVGGPGQMSPGARTAQMAPGMQSSAYRPPTRRGETNSLSASTTTPTNNIPLAGGGVNGGDRVSSATKRPPLVDVSNVQHQSPALTTIDGNDVKRQRMVGPNGPTTGLDGQIDVLPSVTGKENDTVTS